MEEAAGSQPDEDDDDDEEDDDFVDSRKRAPSKRAPRFKPLFTKRLRRSVAAEGSQRAAQMAREEEESEADEGKNAPLVDSHDSSCFMGVCSNFPHNRAHHKMHRAWKSCWKWHSKRLPK